MLQLSIYTPFTKLIESEEVDFVSVPGLTGEVGILPGHINFITSVGSGLLTYKKDGKSAFIALHYGFLDVNSDRVKICVKIAEESKKLDLERAKSSLKKALGRVDNFIKEGNLEDIEYTKFQSKVGRALTRINVMKRI
ncbi:MAG: ATP synthase F1 subunit epsilon [SAR324 cluster bacterium]|nr:ATP synthase F1 subunit epsilon [SAR324 cluster bacterium]